MLVVFTSRPETLQLFFNFSLDKRKVNMSVPSLTQLAIPKVPLEQVFEGGLLLGPFGKKIITQLQNRVTLEELYTGNLLTADLDLAIFWMALDKVAPTLVWSYLNETLEYGEIPSYPPLSSEGIAFLAEINGYSKKESEDATQDALRDILVDLLILLDHPGEYFIIGEQVGFTWDYIDGYRLFWIPSGPVTYNQAEAIGEPQVPTIYKVATLDDFLQSLINSFANYDYTGRLGFRREDPNQLEIQQRVGLGALRDAYGGNLDVIYDRLWNQDEIILTDGNLDLTLSRLSIETAVIRVIEDYLYIFFSYSRPLYFTPDDGNLIIASLAYNPNRWEFVVTA